MKKSNLKRILALVLTVLMVVGVVPMAVFAVEGGNTVSPEEDYTGTPWSSVPYDTLTDEVKQAYDNFGSKWVARTIYASEVQGGAAMSGTTLSVPVGGQAWLTQTNDRKIQPINLWRMDIGGLDVLLDFDLNVSSESKAGDKEWGYIAANFPTNEGAGMEYNNYPLVAVTVEEVNGEKYGVLSLANKTWGLFYDAVGTPLCKIALDTDIDVKIVLDFATNNDVFYYVFVNGECVGMDDLYEHSDRAANTFRHFWATKQFQQEMLAKWREAEPEASYTDEFMCHGAYFNGGTGIMMTAKDFTFSYYDEDGDGEFFDSSRATTAVTPTADLISFIDFDGDYGQDTTGALKETTYVYGTSGNFYRHVAYTAGAIPEIRDDGKGGGALYVSTDYFQFNGPSVHQHWGTTAHLGTAQVKGDLGKSFVYSLDVKLAPNWENSASLFTMGTSYVNVSPLHVDTDGKLYASIDSNGYVMTTANVKPAGDSIAQLSKEYFTTVAIFVDPVENKWQVFINGVAATEELDFLSPADQAKVANNASGTFKTTDWTYMESKTTAGIFDNISLTHCDSYVYENTDPVTGFMMNNGKLYYYENAQIVEAANGWVNGYYYAGGVKQVSQLIDDGDGLYYYVDANGEMVKDVVIEIDGVYYQFDEDGYGWELDYGIFNPETGEFSDSIADAIAAANPGETLVLFGDVDESEIFIDKAITLDLNGKTITADVFVISDDDAKIVTNAENKGFINVPKDGMTVTMTTSDTIVVYNGTGYEFAAVKDQSIMEANDTNDGFKLVFRPSLFDSTDYNQAVFGTGSDAANVDFLVILEDAEGNVLKECKVSDALVAEAYSTNMAFMLTITGVDASFGEITVKYVIASGTGMQCVIGAGTYTAPAAE